MVIVQESWSQKPQYAQNITETRFSVKYFKSLRRYQIEFEINYINTQKHIEMCTLNKNTCVCHQHKMQKMH